MRFVSKRAPSGALLHFQDKMPHEQNRKILNNRHVIIPAVNITSESTS
jgi:hypothetical protein